MCLIYRFGGFVCFHSAWRGLGLCRGRLRLAAIPVMLAGLVTPMLDRPPDLLISADARLIALHTPRGMFLQQSQGGAKFTRDAWVQYWDADLVKPIPVAGDAADGAIYCADGACLLGRTRTDRVHYWCVAPIIRLAAIRFPSSFPRNRPADCAQSRGRSWPIALPFGGRAAWRSGWIRESADPD